MNECDLSDAITETVAGALMFYMYKLRYIRCRLLLKRELTQVIAARSFVRKRNEQLLHTVILLSRYWFAAPCGAGACLFPPCPFTFSSFPPFYFSLSFIGFTYFLLLSIPSLSTRIVPLRFQAGGCRRRPNLGLVCVLLCNLCYLYSLVKMDCGVLFYLV